MEEEDILERKAWKEKFGKKSLESYELNCDAYIHKGINGLQFFPDY
jgi:hypothetical protein